MPQAPRPDAIRPLPGVATQTTRARHAAAALSAALAEFSGRLPASDPAAADLFAARVLAADDCHGRASGLIVQGDAVGWPSVAALELLARRGQRAHRQDDRHPAGVTALTCPLCAAVFALDVHLTDGLAAFQKR